MSYVLRVVDATKVIKRATVLDHVSFELTQPGIYGFLGINGSGKSMLFRAVSGLIRLTSGYVETPKGRLGTDYDFLPDLGLCFESSGFWDEMSGMKNLLRLASIRGIVGREEAAQALERVGLNPEDARPFSAYSMGMRQRLTLAQAIMEHPSTLILDEPTNSLDVDGIEMVRSVLCEERDRGATVLVSCHGVQALEEVFDRAFIMSSGRLTEVTSHG